MKHFLFSFYQRYRVDSYSLKCRTTTQNCIKMEASEKHDVYMDLRLMEKMGIDLDQLEEREYWDTLENEQRCFDIWAKAPNGTNCHQTCR